MYDALSVYLWELPVDPDYRGKGVGTVLTDAVFDRIVDRRADLIWMPMALT